MEQTKRAAALIVGYHKDKRLANLFKRKPLRNSSSSDEKFENTINQNGWQSESQGLRNSKSLYPDFLAGYTSKNERSKKIADPANPQPDLSAASIFSGFKPNHSKNGLFF